MEGQICIQCNEFKPLAAFDVAFEGENAKMGFTQRTNHKHRCRACYALRDRVRTKLNFIKMYGGQCTCCGETDPRFLTLDHTKDDGNEHRKDLACNQIMAYAVKHYEPENYQVLCYNCNCGKSTNGGICPHKDKTFEEYLSYTRILLENVGKVHVKTDLAGLTKGPKASHERAQENQLKQLLKNLGSTDVENLVASLKIHNGTLL
jgi:hypothetical protein